MGEERGGKDKGGYFKDFLSPRMIVDDTACDGIAASSRIFSKKCGSPRNDSESVAWLTGLLRSPDEYVGVPRNDRGVHGIATSILPSEEEVKLRCASFYTPLIHNGSENRPEKNY